MFKNLFKGVKKALQNPIVQLGIGAFVPGMAAGMSSGLMKSVLTNPALLQGGIGLLSGAKPESVLRNIGYGALASGLGAFPGAKGNTFGERMGNYFRGADGKVIAQAATGGGQTAGGIYDSATGKVIPGTDGKGFPIPDSSSGSSGMMDFLYKHKLINTEGKDFFEMYSPLLKLGTVGLSVAAAIMGEDAAKDLYDPNKNPYLTGDTKISDVYTPLEYNRGGIGSYAKGGMDNLRKNGMVYGPGGPKDDLIDAKLSNGEFVFTAAAVDKAGGPRAMYSLMNKLDPNSETYMESRGGIARV